MDETEVKSLCQMEAFLTGIGAVEFAGRSRDEVYAWTGKTTGPRPGKLVSLTWDERHIDGIEH